MATREVVLEDRFGDVTNWDVEEPLPKRMSLFGKWYERFEGIHYKEVPFRNLQDTQRTVRLP